MCDSDEQDNCINCNDYNCKHNSNHTINDNLTNCFGANKCIIIYRKEGSLNVMERYVNYNDAVAIVEMLLLNNIPAIMVRQCTAY